MTPPATPAGRAAIKRQGAGSGAGRPSAATTTPVHRREGSRRAAPKAPRRLSGPIRGRLAGTPSARAAPAARPLRARRTAAPLGARFVAFVRALPDHPLLDRLIRGRAWIPLLGVLLAGIVAMQVEVLKLNAGMGRSIERAATLQNRNEQLRATVAALDADQRIERLAAAKGMIMPAPAAVGFLSSGSPSGATVHRAIANIHAPDAPGFLALISSNGGVATTLSSQATDATGAQIASASATQTGSYPQIASSAPSSPSIQSATATPPAASSQTSAVQPASASQTGAATQTTPGTGTGTGVAVSSPTQSSGSTSGGAGIPVGG